VFFGKVKSGFDQCKRNRKVELRKVKKGPDPTVGKATSLKKGDWVITERGAHGRYYAVARPRPLTIAGGDHLDCLRGRSRRIKV
jgi:hypothetical protein